MKKPKSISLDEAENRFKLSELVQDVWGPLANYGWEKTLVFEGNTEIDGDFFQLFPGSLIVVAGDLSVKGNIDNGPHVDGGSCLFVFGNLIANVLGSNNELIWITGKATIKHVLYGFFNMGQLTIKGDAFCPYLLNDDHSMDIAWTDQTISINCSGRDASYTYSVNDLENIIDPSLLGKNGLNIQKFVRHVLDGKNPIKTA